MGLSAEVMAGEDKKRLARALADRWNELTKEEKRVRATGL